MSSSQVLPEILLDYLGKPDKRSTKWTLTNNYQWPTIFLCLYMVLVYYGPKYMKNRKPFELKNLLIAHNVAQVILSCYVVKLIIQSLLMTKNLSLICIRLDSSNNPNAMLLAEATWYFYFSKFYDLMDTVLIILRKKQLIFLHVYHHAWMVFFWYLGVIYLPGGQAWFPVFLNSAVHIIMYSYYLLAASKLNKKYLWWKRYLTQLQLGQFVVILLMFTHHQFYNCQFPFFLYNLSMFFLVTLTILFSSFYFGAYVKQPEKKTS